FAQKAKYCGRYPLKSVWLFVHVLNVLCWPVLAPFLEGQPGQHILDIACGNGLTSRRLALLGADVTAFDFSANLIDLAKERLTPDSRIAYHVIDATEESAL